MEKAPLSLPSYQLQQQAPAESGGSPPPVLTWIGSDEVNQLRLCANGVTGRDSCIGDEATHFLSVSCVLGDAGEPGTAGVGSTSMRILNCAIF